MVRKAVEGQRMAGTPPSADGCCHRHNTPLAAVEMPGFRTRRLLREHGGVLYDSDSYADELPYYVSANPDDPPGKPHCLFPPAAMQLTGLTTTAAAGMPAFAARPFTARASVQTNRRRRRIWWSRTLSSPTTRSSPPAGAGCCFFSACAWRSQRVFALLCFVPSVLCAVCVKAGAARCCRCLRQPIHRPPSAVRSGTRTTSPTS